MRHAIKVLAAFALSSNINTAQADQTKPELNALFDVLRSSTDLVEMSVAQNEIWIHWYELPADSTALQTIFDDGMRALHFGQPQIAVTHFSRVIESAPHFAEAWNRRATTFFMLGDFEASLADIQQTLALEPRHFGALSGLSMIFENTEQFDRAIQAELLLLDLMPNNGLIRARIDQLRQKALDSRI